MKRIVVLASVLLMVSVFSFTFAQQAVPTTPITTTPASTKTHTPTPTAELRATNTASADSATTQTPVTVNSVSFEPFTQADLSIITGNVQRPNGIVWFNNKLYTACTGDSTLYEIDAITGRTLTYIGGVRNVHTLYAEDSGANALSVWTADFETGELLHITRGSINRVGEGLQSPWGIAALDEQHFLISSSMGNSLIRMSRDGERQVMVDALSSPTGLVVHEVANAVYVANYGSTRRAVEMYTMDDLENSEAMVLVRGLQNATGLVLADDGYLYMAYSLGSRGVVGRVNPRECAENGGCTNEDVEIVIYTDLVAPLAGLTISDDMRLFVHTMFQPEIYWVQLPV